MSKRKLNMPHIDPQEDDEYFSDFSASPITPSRHFEEISLTPPRISRTMDLDFSTPSPHSNSSILDYSSASDISEPYRKKIAYDSFATLSNPFVGESENEKSNDSTGKDSNLRYINDFEQLSLLGKGQFSVVYLCTKRLDGCKYAIKKIKHPIQSKSEQKIALHDVFASSSLAFNSIFNIHIVKYYSCWQEESTLYMQYEACEYGQVNTTLYEKYNRNIPEKVILQILYQMSDALATLHTNGYVHLDIKPDNILISKMGNAEGEKWLFKICDFGLMSKSDGSINYSEGDSRYCSLEVMNEEKNNLCSSDIFSLGLSIYELCIGEELPSAGDEWQQLREGNFTRKLKVSPHLQILLKKMIAPNAMDRPSVNDVMNNPLFYL